MSRKNIVVADGFRVTRNSGCLDFEVEESDYRGDPIGSYKYADYISIKALKKILREMGIFIERRED